MVVLQIMEVLLTIIIAYLFLSPFIRPGGYVQSYVAYKALVWNSYFG